MYYIWCVCGVCKADFVWHVFFLWAVIHLSVCLFECTVRFDVCAHLEAVLGWPSICFVLCICVWERERDSFWRHQRKTRKVNEIKSLMLFCLPLSPHQRCIYLVRNTVQTVILWNNIIILNNYILIYFNVIYSCDCKAEFSAAITPVFSVTWSFRNHSDRLICCLINIEYSCACLISFVETLIWFLNERHLIRIFWNNVKVFTFTFD